MASFGRLERSAAPAPMSEINMTPLIDVMLVLLVIFMITAPLMASSLKLDLPDATGARPGDAPAFVTVAIDAQGQLFLADERVEPAALESRLSEAAKARPETEVQLRADRAVPYGQVVELIGRIQAAGLNRIAFVAQSPAAP